MLSAIPFLISLIELVIVHLLPFKALLMPENSEMTRSRCDGVYGVVYALISDLFYPINFSYTYMYIM